MTGLKEICALFVAGSMGAGSVVAVQKVRAPAPRVHQVKAPKAHRPAPRPHVATALPPAQQVAITDCPTSSLGGMGLANLSPESLPPIPGSHAVSLPELAGTGVMPIYPGFPGGGGSGGGGGGGSGTDNGGGGKPIPPDPTNPATTPGVPEPASWAMMVSGVGLVGLALRRNRTPAAKSENA